MWYIFSHTTFLVLRNFCEFSYHKELSLYIADWQYDS